MKALRTVFWTRAAILFGAFAAAFIMVITLFSLIYLIFHIFRRHRQA